jgi:hypothetical protein
MKPRFGGRPAGFYLCFMHWIAANHRRERTISVLAASNHFHLAAANDCNFGAKKSLGAANLPLASRAACPPAARANLVEKSVVAFLFRCARCGQHFSSSLKSMTDTWRSLKI